ncbi:ribosomal protein S18-alanine N-acetyltransferase [Desulfoplanes sp.]
MVDVRLLDVRDIPELVKLETLCFPRPWTAKEFAACMAHDHFRALGIVSLNAIVAYITFFVLVDELEIVNLAVREDHRRQGLGQRLLAKIIEYKEKRGLERIVLEVRKSNTAARRLYTLNGFVRVGVRKGYYPPDGEDALVLAHLSE